jgi:tetratricopeptide (TPR) repeat protein
MVENRQKAYQELIFDLLTHAGKPGLEKLLESRKELLDAGLANEMEIIATSLEKTGKSKTAEWLRSLADILITSDPHQIVPTFQNYLIFLQGLLSEYWDNFESLRTIFQLPTNKHQDLYKKLSLILKVTTEILPELESSDAAHIAVQIGSFSNQLSHFQMGSKRDNIEIAILSYEACLAIFSPTAFKESWITTQINLGNAYQQRQVGSKKENLEKAISIYKLACQVCTIEVFPREWGRLQECLGISYYQRLGGHKFKNLEQAVEHFQAALTVFTKENYPYEWATTYANLGSTYADHVYTDSLEKSLVAIDACHSALEVLTQREYPGHWATIQAILGDIYTKNILGNRALPA